MAHLIKTSLRPDPKLGELLRKAQERFDALSPEAQVEYRAEQRRSYARSLMD